MSYQPKHSNDRFSAVDWKNPAQVEAACKELISEYRRNRDMVADHEQRLRDQAENTRHLWNAISAKANPSLIPKVIDEAEGKRARTTVDTWKLRTWAVLILLIGAAIGAGVKYLGETKPQNAPLRYDKDGIPLDR